MARVSVKLIHAALDEGENGEILLRGVIDPASLPHLQVAEYQREVQPLSKIRDLAEAFKNYGQVPDIDLGMRGGNFLERDGAYYLQDAVYIIDGLQRRTGAEMAMKSGFVPKLGATVHFNTTEQWEMNRFRVLNMTRVKLSPNVLLRNLRNQNAFVEMLYNLTLESSFVLHNKVCWEQRMRREQLITALSLAKAIGALHESFSSGMRSSSHQSLSDSMLKLMNRIGRSTMKENIKTFWDVIEECWGLKTVHFKEGAIYLRLTFLLVLGELFSRHQDFWKDSKLFVPIDLRKKIATFPITDPNVANLAGTSGPARNLLYTLLVEHVNSGKRSRRLTPKKRRRQETEEIEADVRVTKSKVTEEIAA